MGSGLAGAQCSRRCAAWCCSTIVKQLTAGAPLYREGAHARSHQRGQPVAERARRVHVEYEHHARELDRDHCHLPSGAPYPAVREQQRLGLVGPVLAALRGYPQVQGLVVGSWQGSSAGVHALAREAAEAQAASHWRLMGARSESEALGIYTSVVQARWSSTFWRSWVHVIHGRRPCVGRADDRALVGGPEPVGRGAHAAGGAAAYPCAGPAVVAGARAAAGLGGGG